MVDFNIDDILREASYKSKKGYLDLSLIEDVRFLENIMYEMKYPSNFIVEYIDDLMYENIRKKLYTFESKDLLDDGVLDSIKKFISTTWVKLKSFINTAFNKASKYLKDGDTFDEEYKMIIPIQLYENVNVASNLLIEAGSPEEAKKGYFNEALVCQNILKYSADKMVVNISPDKLKIRNKEINTIIQKYRKEISDKKVIDEAEIGSEAMSNYLINSAKSNGVVIVDIFLSGMEKNIMEKKDITLFLKRGMSEPEAENYSLKLYKGFEIGMSNMTVNSLIYNLTNTGGPATEKGKRKNEYTEEVEKILLKMREENPEYKKYWNASKKLSDKKKKYKKGDKEYKVLEKKRTVVRAPLNAMHAEVVFKFLKKFIDDEENKKIFISNLLQLIGFSDSDTKILLAVMKRSADNTIVRAIIDTHPELSLKDIKLTKPARITIKVFNGGKLIVKIDFNEGEKRKALGKVDFSKQIPVEPEYWQSIK